MQAMAERSLITSQEPAQQAAQRPSAQKRQVAHFVTLRQLSEGTYVREEGWQPNYVLVDDGRKVSRINTIAVVVDKEEQLSTTTMTVDDGTATIAMRSFDNDQADIFADHKVGDMLLIIGRPREYNAQKYIIPEIIRKLADQRWAEVRKKQLELLSRARSVRPVQTGLERAEGPEGLEEKQRGQRQQPASGHAQQDTSSQETVAEEDIAEEQREPTPAEKLCLLIKGMDNGNGAEVGELIAKAAEQGISNGEQLVNRMIAGGDIFEVKAGRVKVL